MEVLAKDFLPTCLALHKQCKSPIIMMFAEDNRKINSCYRINVVFHDREKNAWPMVSLDVPEDEPEYPSLSREMYSAGLFERDILETFGIVPVRGMDSRRLRLHDESWPEDLYPMRKDFQMPKELKETGKKYEFVKGEGEGLFEYPVGPVHAGVIGSGHFHFTVAGEPIINLEIRLGFAHRGILKLMEGKSVTEALKLSECVAGDSAFGHSSTFCQAVERIQQLAIPLRAALLRVIYLELERMYNHVSDIGGIALDVGYSFASSFAAIMKENLLQLNQMLSGSRYLKGINIVGGVAKDINEKYAQKLINKLNLLEKDINELEKILFGSASFMDRVETTGILRKTTAEDIGVMGLAARASGIPYDLRTESPIYVAAGFKPIVEESGDVLARLKVRLEEFKQSISLIQSFVSQLKDGDIVTGSGSTELATRGLGVQGWGTSTSSVESLGAVEGWRGPIFYWLKITQEGKIDRCSIVDSSFNNWQGLAYAVMGEIIPDFPVCNKSFDLSYSGNDL